jgi:hypothetical protein
MTDAISLNYPLTLARVLGLMNWPPCCWWPNSSLWVSRGTVRHMSTAITEAVEENSSTPLWH